MDEPTPPAVPPTQPGTMVRAKPASNWATVIGMIAIVFGVLGMLGGVFGVVVSFLPALAAFGLPLPQGLVEVMREWTVWNVSSSIAMVTVSALLLAAGIKLLKRRPDAVRWCKMWAIIKILLVFVAGIGNALHQQDINAATSAAQQPTLPPGSSVEFAISAGSVVFGILWGWALPVFMLIWFRRQKIKAETAEWGNGKAFPVTEPSTEDAL